MKSERLDFLGRIRDSIIGVIMDNDHETTIIEKDDD